MDFKFWRGTLLDHGSKILKWFTQKCHSLLSSTNRLRIYLHICWKFNCSYTVQYFSALVPIIVLKILKISCFKIAHFYFLGIQRIYFDRNTLYAALLPLDRSYKEQWPKVLHLSFSSAAQLPAIKNKKGPEKRSAECLGSHVNPEMLIACDNQNGNYTSLFTVGLASILQISTVLFE